MSYARFCYDQISNEQIALCERLLLSGDAETEATSPGKRRNRSAWMLPDPGVQQWTVPGNTSPPGNEPCDFGLTMITQFNLDSPPPS